jgi:hypothetical protein
MVTFNRTQQWRTEPVNSTVAKSDMFGEIFIKIYSQLIPQTSHLCGAR